MRAEEGKMRVKHNEKCKKRPFSACLYTLPSLPVGWVPKRRYMIYLREGRASFPLPSPSPLPPHLLTITTCYMRKKCFSTILLSRPINRKSGYSMPRNIGVTLGKGQHSPWWKHPSLSRVAQCRNSSCPLSRVTPPPRIPFTLTSQRGVK
jgi:hypothetical protein